MDAATIFKNIKITGKGLACTRGELPVFSHMNFDLTHGDTLHIQGKNGVGKSTLLRALAGLHPFTMGTLVQNNLPIKHLGDLGCLFLDHLGGLHPDLAVHQQISLWVKLYHLTHRPTCVHNKHVPIRHLSAGQRQKLLLTQLTSTRLIWLLDEPFSNLDAPHIKHVYEAIKKHTQEGGIVIIVSHQEFEVADLTLKVQHIDKKKPR